MYNIYNELPLCNGFGQQHRVSICEPNIDSPHFLHMIAGIEFAQGNHWENRYYTDKAGKWATDTTQGTSLTDTFEESKGLPPIWHTHKKTILTTISARAKTAKILRGPWASRITAGDPSGFDPKGGEEYV